MDIAQTLARARRSRLDGDWHGAELLCRQVLDKNPVHAEVNGLLGQLLAEHDDFGAAQHYVSIALGLAPVSADVRLNSAALKDRQGDLKGALDEAKRASELDPRKFEVWASYGNLLGKAGLFEQAAKALRAACSINPHHPGAGLLLAGACFEIDDLAGAGKALDQVERAASGLPQTLKLRTHLARKAGDEEAIVQWGEQWIAAEPESDEARMALAYGLAQGGFYARAAEIFRPVAEREPKRADYLATMGRHYLGARDLDAARDWFRQALAVDPDFEEAHYGFARVETYSGRLADAEAHCRTAIAIDPGHIDALALLAEVTDGRIGDAEFENLKALSLNPNVRLDSSATAAYAFGDACHRRSMRDEAFAAWTRANARKTDVLRASPAGVYDPAKQERFARRVREVFASDPLSAPYKDDAGGRPAPVFIVGMPRSGTTLLENALSAHPLVAGGGELPGLPYMLDEVLPMFAGGARAENLAEDARASLRDMYFRQLAEFKLENRPFFTDKQPTNFWSVGLIRVLFPHARLIHIRRNPLDTGFSIFRRNFSKRWPFAFDQRAIGHYYGQYARIMDHWRRNYPSAVALVQYEELVENFEGELRRLLDWCGLPFDERCVKYHENERSVITFSAVQVRKGASKAHSGSAAPYREQLKPMADALAAAGVDLQTGALAGA